jgi:DNA-binding NarL/FixJ family response regulator
LIVTAERRALGSAIVIDEWALVRWGLVAEVRRYGFGEVYEAETATAAVALVRSLPRHPTLAVVGSVSDQSEAAITRTLACGHGCTVVALLGARHKSQVLTVLQAGALAVIERDARSMDLHNTIAAALAGDRQLGSEMIAVLSGATDRGRLHVDLTPREREVLDAMAAGRTNAQIAHRLAISEETVKTHVAHVFQKLGVNSRAHAVALAARLSLI